MASALSAFGGMFLVLFVRNKIWYQILAHFVLNTAMVWFCFGTGRKKEFLENWMVTYVMVILLGGSMEWMQQNRMFGDHSMIPELIAATALFSVVAYLIQYRSFGSYVLSVTLKKNGKSTTLRGYYDSGNQLRDPYTGKAVSILNRKVAESFIQLSETKIRLVPYRTLGQEHGLLEVIELEEIAIDNAGRTTIVRDAAIGMGDEELFWGKQYDMILHAALLDQGTPEKRRKVQTVRKSKGK